MQLYYIGPQFGARKVVQTSSRKKSYQKDLVMSKINLYSSLYRAQYILRAVTLVTPRPGKPSSSKKYFNLCIPYYYYAVDLSFVRCTNLFCQSGILSRN